MGGNLRTKDRFRRKPPKKRWGLAVSIDRAKFTAWLEAKPPAMIVGERYEAHECPVATFHNFHASEKPPPYQIKIIADDEIGCWAETQEGYRSEVLEVPYWVVRFVEYLDGDIEDEGDLVTAGQALRTLARIG